MWERRGNSLLNHDCNASNPKQYLQRQKALLLIWVGKKIGEGGNMPPLTAISASPGFLAAQADLGGGRRLMRWMYLCPQCFGLLRLEKGRIKWKIPQLLYSIYNKTFIEAGGGRDCKNVWHDITFFIDFWKSFEMQVARHIGGPQQLAPSHPQRTCKV